MLILAELFERLKEQNVDFCVLSGYEEWPLIDSSGDIDLIVSKEGLDRASDLLKSVFGKHGSPYYILSKVKGRRTYIFCFPGKDGFIRDSLKVDLFVNFEFRSRIFLSSREVLRGKVSYRNFYVPSEVHKAFMGIVKGILKGGAAWNKYLPGIQGGLRNHGDEVVALLIPFFGRRTVDSLRSQLSAGNIDDIEKTRTYLIRETYRRSFLRNPISFPVRMLAYCVTAGVKYLNPPNYMIAVLGPDGVGKSTVIEHMKRHLSGLLKVESRRTKSFHIRPGLFPTITGLLRKWRGHIEERPSFIYKTWRSPSRGISFVRLLCFWFDYLAGYMVKILPELGSENVVILDRYFFDLLVDPSRYDIRLSYRFMKPIFNTLPKPKVTIVLDAPSEIIFERKKELSTVEIEALRDKYRRLRGDFENVHILEAMGPPDQLSREAVSTFLERAAVRLT